MTGQDISRSPPPARWVAALEAVGPILTLATAFNLIRVFDGGGWVLPVFIAIAASHFLAITVRRFGAGMLISTLTSAVGLIFTVTWTRYWDTAFWGFPSGDTRSMLFDDLQEAWSEFGDLSTPVEPLTGFVVSAMAASWLIGFLSDWTAVRMRTLFEPMLLPIAAVGFVGLVGDDRYRTVTTGVFVAALLLFFTVHKLASRSSSTTWLGGEGRASLGRRALLSASAAMAAVALAAAVVAGPVLGSNESPLVDLTETIERGQRGTGRVVISPLVDIRGRLVSQAETVMFRVRSDERSYWRLTALDQFDGQVWTSRAEYAARPTLLPSLFQSGSTVQPSVQEFQIARLSTVWLPAAFEPRAVYSDTADISYEPSSSTLIVGRSLTNSNALSYTVTSALPRFDPDELKAIPLFDPENVLEDGSEVNSEEDAEDGVDSALDLPDVASLAPLVFLPDDFSPGARELAELVTHAADSGYEQALALQNFFRSGAFIYDANVAPGHSGSRIDDFLESRRGYCEQFAGTFAAMARSVGLPARVAVGFTVGEADPADPNLYVVRGKHAHAWPEVFLAGVGWVAFEPTPGRGAPGAQNYTGLAESQVLPADEPEALDDSGVSTDNFIDFESLFPPELQDPADLEQAATQDGGGGLSTGSWLAISIPVAIVLLLLIVPVLQRRRRRRRFKRMPGNRGEIRLFWAEAVDALALINMVPRSDETHDEFARRAIDQVPLHSPDLRQLGELAAAATFAPSEPDDRHQWLAHTWSLSVRAEVNFRVTRLQKLVAAYIPRGSVGFSTFTLGQGARRRRDADD